MKAATASHRLAPYLFVAPFVLLFVVFMVYPMILSIDMSLYQSFGPRSSKFVGLDNFIWLFHDPDFRTAVINTAIFSAGSLFIQLPCSLALALLLNKPGLKARGFWRLIFFAPSLVGMAFVAILAALVFEKHEGMLNVILHQITGLHVVIPWLEQHVMAALIIAAFWMFVGFNMVYFLAALQNVSPDLLDAAKVDGAAAWHRFRHVTLPAIKPVAGFVSLLSLIGSVQLFELPYLMLNNSAGPDDQGLTVVMFLYQHGFDTGNLGYASAVGWVIAIALGLFAFIYDRWLSDSEGA